MNIHSWNLNMRLFTAVMLEIQKKVAPGDCDAVLIFLNSSGGQNSLNR
jgi:hypothetical protein